MTTDVRERVELRREGEGRELCLEDTVMLLERTVGEGRNFWQSLPL